MVRFDNKGALEIQKGIRYVNNKRDRIPNRRNDRVGLPHRGYRNQAHRI